jgi:TetR/AcrR family transcriptional regulator
VKEEKVVKIGRERDAEVAREAILDAAEEVFSCEGFDGARVDAIAAKSEYNKSLIFHYFGGKEGLYQEVVKRMKARLTDEFSGPLMAFVQSSNEINSERVQIFLEMAVECYFAFLTKHPRNLRIMAWEAAEGWHAFMYGSSKETEEQKASLVCLCDFLRRGQLAGIISKELDVRFLMINIGNMCIMHLLSLPRYQWFLGEAVTDKPESLARIRQQIVHLVLYGLFTSSHEGKHL